MVNALDEESSIHWHGLLLPFQMDGVPGISFPGIPAAGASPMNSPSCRPGLLVSQPFGLQEQEGLYGRS